MYALFQKMLNVSSEHSFTLLEASPIQISPFLFEDYLQIVNTDFLKPGIKKNYLKMKPQSSKILTLSPLMALHFPNEFMAKRHPKFLP